MFLICGWWLPRGDALDVRKELIFLEKMVDATGIEPVTPSV
jgi:hypothetical protein